MESILLVEDHPIVRMGLSQLIQQRWPGCVVHEAGSLAEALAQVKACAAPFAVVDLNLPDASALESVVSLRRAAPATRLLVLSLHDEAAYAHRALKLGAAGYLSKDRAGDELIIALERIVAGGRYITGSQAEMLADLALGTGESAPHEALSDQEHRVMVHLAEGRRLTDIAELMHLSPKTVSTYRTRVLDKLHLTSNSELVRYCLAQGLVS
jgi:DNA-binding NarL/FixJ family response regulator